jgi:hypothetical protein
MALGTVCGETILSVTVGYGQFLVLQILGGDRYCVKYGADGNVRNREAGLFRVTHPVAEGCPS